MNRTTVRREIRYCGRVQGVGFRFTTREIAGRFEVVGFVENLADGSVLLVAEGTAEELDRFAAAVDEEMNRFITSSSAHDSPASGTFTEFFIRR